MIKTRIITIGLTFLLFSSYCFSMVYDNRFFPLFKRPYSKKIDSPSRLAVDFFATAANCAQGSHVEAISIPEIFGSYSQGNLGRAMVICGMKNPLRDELQDMLLPWCIEGNIKGQGISVVYDQALGNYLFFGGSCLFMSVNSLQTFIFDIQESGLMPTEREISDIYDARCQMHKMLCMESQNSHQVGFGDIDVYLRLGYIWEFLYKFRRIDAGIQVGGLLATGVERKINCPSSVPFGGNGHYGFYVSADTELEFKEDMKVGLMGRFNKRFAKNSIQRLPLAKEHLLFGALQAPVQVCPGFSCIFDSYFSWEQLNKGFGACIGYTLVYHSEDTWSDLRPIDAKESCPIDMCNINCFTSWAYDYVNLNLFYDFGKVKIDRDIGPVLTLTWNIPAFLLVGKNAPKTHRVCFGLEVNF